MAELNRLKNDGRVPSSMFMTENIDFRTKSNENNRAEVDLYEVLTIAARNGLFDTRPYKVYRALINQTGTGDPTVVVYENTTGANFSFTRDDVGEYFLEITGDTSAFPPPSPSDVTIAFYNVSQNILISGQFDNETEVVLSSIVSSTGVPTDGVITNVIVEIKSYNI